MQIWSKAFGKADLATTICWGRCRQVHTPIYVIFGWLYQEPTKMLCQIVPRKSVIIKDEVVPDRYNAMRFKVGDLGASKVIEDIDAMNTLLAEWMLPPEAIDPVEYGELDHRVDIYHCGLLFLQVLQGRTLSLTRQQVLDGIPRQMAESLPPPFNFALAKALRRHVIYRTASAMEFWRDLQHPNQESPNQASDATSEPAAGAASSAHQG